MLFSVGSFNYVRQTTIEKHKQTQMPVNYQNAKIYTIVNDLNDTVYVGSTAQKLLSSRMTCHRRLSQEADRTSPLYVAMRTLGIAHFRIILQKAAPCQNKDELEAAEYKELKAFIDAGTSVYNMRTAPTGFKLGEETKVQIAKSLHGRFRGAESCHFKCGSLSYKASVQQWKFEWYENGAKKTKSFSERKWGEAAKTMAENHRRTIYPNYESENTDIPEA